LDRIEEVNAMSKKLGLILFAVAFTTVAAYGGRFNKKLNIGDPAPNFEKLEGVDGKLYSLNDFRDKEVLVLCITCNHCPVAQAYEDRIIAFARKYASGPDSKVAFVAINVNNIEEDRLPKMRERAKAKGFNFPYLYDPSQRIGKALGATVTPEFFVFNRERKLVYMGAMDDSQTNPKVNYLAEAVEAALRGEAPRIAETRARGCTVKYEN
jgi:peroxiredoxin